MELSQIKYFLKVAKMQHVTKAAEELHIAQPALTRAVHKLEDELGVPLFINKGRNIVLSEYGMFLKSKLEPVMSELEDIPKSLADMSEREAHTIRINVGAASRIITTSIIEYKKKKENVNFLLAHGEGEHLADIKVYTDWHKYDICENDHRHIYTEHILIAAPNNDKFSEKKSICLEELKQEGFICLAGSKQFRQICDKYCVQAGFVPNIIFESDDPVAVRNLIAASMGVGFWPEYSWGKKDRTGVIFLPVEDVDCRRDIILSLRSNKKSCTEVEEYFKFLIEFIDEYEK